MKKLKPKKMPKCEFCGKNSAYAHIKDKVTTLRICLKCIKRALGNLL